MEQAPSSVAELEALTQFLYLAPIGLVQASLLGEIAMINPMSAQLLMPLSRDGELVNLFDVLADVAPDLRHRASTYPPRNGMSAMACNCRSGASRLPRRPRCRRSCRSVCSSSTTRA